MSNRRSAVDEEEGDEDDEVIDSLMPPTKPIKTRKPSSSTPIPLLATAPAVGAAGGALITGGRKSLSSSPRSNKVGDDGGGSNSAPTTPVFAAIGAPRQQSGRHAGSLSLGNLSAGAGGGGGGSDTASVSGVGIELGSGKKSTHSRSSSLSQTSSSTTQQPAPPHQRNDSISTNGGGPNARQQQQHHKTLAPSSAQKKKPEAKKGTSKDYVASRVWKNESSMTFGMRVKLAEQPSMWADLTFATTNIVDVWEHYDINKDDVLNKSEIPALASDLVDRFIQLYREQLLRDQPSLKEDELQRLIKKDIFPHLLQGDNLAQAKQIVTERLNRELDVDNDGIISKTEFFFQWKNSCKAFLTIAPPKGGMACVIL